MANTPAQSPGDIGGEFLSESLDDYLLALADGIYRAQQQLSQMSVDLQPGQPSVTYQLPKVEFELRMAYEMTGGAIRVRPAEGLAGAAGGAKSVEASSLIRGAFVAVPALGGKPAPVVTTSIERFETGQDEAADSHRYRIVVQVSDNTGAKLADREVRFDIDWALRDALNLSAGYRGELDRQAEEDLKATTQRDQSQTEKRLRESINDLKVELETATVGTPQENTIKGALALDAAEKALRSNRETELDKTERGKIERERGVAVTDQAGRASCEVSGNGFRWSTFVPVRVSALGYSETLTFEMRAMGATE